MICKMVLGLGGTYYAAEDKPSCWPKHQPCIMLDRTICLWSQPWYTQWKQLLCRILLVSRPLHIDVHRFGNRMAMLMSKVAFRTIAHAVRAFDGCAAALGGSAVGVPRLHCFRCLTFRESEGDNLLAKGVFALSQVPTNRCLGWLTGQLLPSTFDPHREVLCKQKRFRSKVDDLTT